MGRSNKGRNLPQPATNNQPIAKVAAATFSGPLPPPALLQARSELPSTRQPTICARFSVLSLFIFITSSFTLEAIILDPLMHVKQYFSFWEKIFA
jgi:hypothetical protein